MPLIKTPTAISSYRLLFGMACHLPIELEHCAFWVIKAFNFDIKPAGSSHRLQLNNLDEWRNEAY